MLKFEGKFKRGDIIVAHDFHTRLIDGVRRVCAIHATITNERVVSDEGANCYEVVVIRDIYCNKNVESAYSRVGEIVYVPFETSMEETFFNEHDRIYLL